MTATFRDYKRGLPQVMARVGVNNIYTVASLFMWPLLQDATPLMELYSRVICI